MKNQIMRVNVSELNIEREYQRELNRVLVKKISNNFDMKYFGVLMVSQRKNGKLYVIDGQHRLEAARLAGVSMVPISVNNIWDIKKEAIAYSEMNENRRALTPIEKYKSAVVGGIRPQIDIYEWMVENDLEVKNDSKSGNAIRNINSVIKSWDKDEDSAKTAIMFCLNVERSSLYKKPINSKMFSGAFMLLRRGVDIMKHVDKVSSVGGRVTFLQAVSAEANYCTTSNNSVANARALLSMINKNKRKRITVDFHR